MLIRQTATSTPTSEYSTGVAAKGSLGIFESAGKIKDSLKNFDSNSNNKNSSTTKTSGNSEAEVNEKRILEKWGTAADGTNQGKKHFYEYWKRQPKRISSLEDRLGVPKGTFENSAEGFKNFTEQAERVIKEAKINGNTIAEEDRKKKSYFIKGAGKNPREGVKVIMYDGKIQSMMPFKVPIK